MFYPIRPVCGYTLDYLTAIVEPVEEKHRELYAEVAFAPTTTSRGKTGGSGWDDQEDEILLNQKSGGDLDSKEKLAKQFAASQKLLKAAEEKVTKLEKAEETRKAKAKLKQEKREAQRTLVGTDKTGSSETKTEATVLPPVEK
jgi:Spy/CpxP family protein refolding chaperone